MESSLARVVQPVRVAYYTYHMNSQDLKKFNLPDAPGVYFFLGKSRKILYIGKATSLKDRVKSYFVRDILMTRSLLIAKMLEEAKKVEFIETDSVLEALLLEASEIKKHQPIYNSKEKDDKSYNYVTITEEDYPQVLITRGSGTYGPFPHGGELKEALKIIRKIFPFRDTCVPYEDKIQKLKGKPPARHRYARLPSALPQANVGQAQALAGGC